MAGTAPRRIDAHHHAVPPGWRAALERIGADRSGGSPLPLWDAASALGVMDRHGIAAAVASVSAPGVWFDGRLDAADLARRCNDGHRPTADPPAKRRNAEGRFEGRGWWPITPGVSARWRSCRCTPLLRRCSQACRSHGAAVACPASTPSRRLPSLCATEVTWADLYRGRKVPTSGAYRADMARARGATGGRDGFSVSPPLVSSTRASG